MKVSQTHKSESEMTEFESEKTEFSDWVKGYRGANNFNRATCFAG